MRRTLVVTTAWITATVLAVSLAFAGVNVVADRVLDPEPSPVVGAAAVDDRPEASASPDEPGDDPTPDDGPTDGPSASPTATPDDGPTPDDDPTHDASEPDDDPTPGGDPTVSPTSSPTSTSSPTQTAAPAETRTYRMVGGTVTVRFSAQQVSVVSASPNDGFSLHEIEQPAATVIDLEFRAHDDSHRSKLDAWWQDGPRERIREETRED